MKRKERLLLAIVSLLGFATACDDKPGGETPLMYGVLRPTADYRITGKITDTAGLPIPGIEIGDVANGRTTNSQTDGSFTLDGKLMRSFVQLRIKDVDGVANGSFADQDFRITFTEGDLDPEKNEVARAGVAISLQPKP